MKPDFESRLEVACDEHRPLGVENGTARESTLDRIQDNLRIEAASRGKDKRLAHRGNVARNHDLVGQFGYIPRPDSAGERDARTHALEQRLRFAEVFSLPPTMITSVPSTAFGSPPLTGASRKSTLLSAQAEAILCETSGLIELISTINEPGLHPARIPSSPNTTSSTYGPSGSIVKIMDARRPTSRFDAPRSAPSATQASSFFGLRPYAITVWPALRRFLIMGRPMMPRPTNPTVAIVVLLCAKAVHRLWMIASLALLESGSYAFCPACQEAHVAAC